MKGGVYGPAHPQPIRSKKDGSFLQGEQVHQCQGQISRSQTPTSKRIPGISPTSVGGRTESGTRGDGAPGSVQVAAPDAGLRPTSLGVSFDRAGTYAATDQSPIILIIIFKR